ncbi:MAG: mannonate dehydratase, partial [Bacteroidota bacterium]
MLLPAKYDERKWTLARQLGVKYAITKAHPDLTNKPAPYDLASLKQTKSNFQAKGIKLFGLEGDQFDMNPIKLGLNNRDEWIEKYIQMLRNMAELDMDLLCYNWMAVFGWYRTNVNILERGEALVSEFDLADVGAKVDERYQIGESELWNNLYYFLEAVLPEAERLGIQMALHPDDPPVSPLRGVARILTSSIAFDKLMTEFPSPANG